MINPLLDLITEHNMQIPLPPGIQTYETTTSNWTRPDNMWCKDNPITICDVDPSLCPPLADHLPIYIVLDLPVQRVDSFPTLSMFNADFKIINKRLSELIAQCCPAKVI